MTATASSCRAAWRDLSPASKRTFNWSHSQPAELLQAINEDHTWLHENPVKAAEWSDKLLTSATPVRSLAIYKKWDEWRRGGDTKPRHKNATEAEKKELVAEYAGLVCTNIDAKFKNPLSRVEYMNGRMQERARNGEYTSIDTFHAHDDAFLDLCLQHTPSTMDDVGRELKRFAVAGDWWWSICVSLPAQERRALVKDVFELVKDNKGSERALYKKVMQLCHS